MITKNTIKTPSNSDLAYYNYLINIPKSKINLIDFMAISSLEEKYPDLKSILPDNKVWLLLKIEYQK